MIYYSLLALVYIYSLFSTVNFIYNRVQSIIEAVLLHVFFEGSGLFYQTLKPPYMFLQVLLNHMLTYSLWGSTPLVSGCFLD